MFNDESGPPLASTPQSRFELPESTSPRSLPHTGWLASTPASSSSACTIDTDTLFPAPEIGDLHSPQLAGGALVPSSPLSPHARASIGLLSASMNSPFGVQVDSPRMTGTPTGMLNLQAYASPQVSPAVMSHLADHPAGATPMVATKHILQTDSVIQTAESHAARPRLTSLADTHATAVKLGPVSPVSTGVRSAFLPPEMSSQFDSLQLATPTRANSSLPSSAHVDAPRLLATLTVDQCTPHSTALPRWQISPRDFHKALENLSTGLEARPSQESARASVPKSRETVRRKTSLSKSASFESTKVSNSVPFSRASPAFVVPSVSLPNSRSSSPLPPNPHLRHGTSAIVTRTRRASLSSAYDGGGEQVTAVAIGGSTISTASPATSVASLPAVDSILTKSDAMMKQTGPISAEHSLKSRATVGLLNHDASRRTAAVPFAEIEFRLECGSGPSHFELDGLPILWRKAASSRCLKPNSQQLPSGVHQLVPTYIYLSAHRTGAGKDLSTATDLNLPAIRSSLPSITLQCDGKSVVIPRSRDINVKHAHLLNFVLHDAEQQALFDIVQQERQKRKPDIITNGVKLHRMQLLVQDQIIPFYYCSQKRITIEKAFTALGSPAGSTCVCAGRCLIASVSELQLLLHRFFKEHAASPDQMAAVPAKPASATSRATTLPANLAPAQNAYDCMLAKLDAAKQIFVAHRPSLFPVSSGTGRSSRPVSKKRVNKRVTATRRAGVHKSSRRRRTTEESDEEEMEEDDQEEEESAPEQDQDMHEQ